MIGKKAKNNVIGNWPNNAFFMISASFIGEIAVRPLGLILSFPLLYFYQTTIRLYAEGFFLRPSSEGQFFLRIPLPLSFICIKKKTYELAFTGLCSLMSRLCVTMFVA